MKRLIDKLQTALSTTYEEHELRAIIRTICCDILGIGTTTYYLKEDVALTNEQEIQFEDITTRLLQGEPLQYIEKRAPFCGFDLRVSPAVLIPRPETAELVDWIVSENRDKHPRILDIGTGSGCIAIALSRQLANISIDACDISPEALAVAEDNARRNDTHIHFFQHDILDTISPLSHTYDILVSNPPYIRQSEAAEMEAHVTNWEPHTALFVPDNDALCFYRAIAELGQTDALRPGGHIYVEINQALGKETAALFEAYGYQDVELRKDIYGNDRMVKAVKSEK